MSGEQERAAPAPSEIVDFIERLAFWRSSQVQPGDIIYRNYPISDAAIMTDVIRALEVYSTWQQNEAVRDTIAHLGPLLIAKRKEAVVDRESGRVEFKFLGSELIALRSAVGFLQDWALTKERDAQQASRPRYPKRKK